MPNTPVAVREGMSAIALGTKATTENGDLIEKIFNAIGKAVIVKENVMDAVTGLSGSGPGYGFVIIDALADAGVKVGLPRQTAIMLAAQSLLGAAKMVLDTGKHPAQLRDMVTSPGGTTIAGIHVLEKNAVRATLIDAVEAATNKSKAMGSK
jgi:pyrroline-5-carboxylate reductase